MDFSNKLITEEIKRNDVFDLKFYLELIKKYGKENVNNFFNSLFDVAEANERKKILNLYYPAYISMKLENFEANTDNCILLIDKFGETNINKYFSDLLTFAQNKTEIKEKYQFFYEQIDEKSLESNDELFYDENYTTTDGYKTYMMEFSKYPVFTADEEKKAFALLSETKKSLEIFSFDEDSNLVINDINVFINSINTYEIKKYVCKLKKFFDSSDEKIVTKFIELFENINGKKKQDIIILPDYQLVNKKLNLSINNETKKYDEDYFNKQLETAIKFFNTKEYICNCNLKLVVSVAKKYRNSTFDIDDRTAEGNIGLMKAIEKFDYTKGYKFSTYAIWWIRQAITRAIADQSRTIRIPVHMFDSIKKMNDVHRLLVMETGKEPTNEEIAKRMNVPVEKIEEMKKTAIEPTSLDVTINEEDDSYLRDFIPSTAPGPEAINFNNSLRESLIEVLSFLTPRERKVLEYRYGINGGKSMTLEEVGAIFGVTRERIRQVESKALRKLKHPSRAKYLKDYIND